MRLLRWFWVGCFVVSCGFAATFGTVVPLTGGASDLVLDEARNRLYLVNSTMNQVEVYSLPQRRFLSPIKTDRQPVSAALSLDGKTLYVTSYDGSSLNLLDLDQLNMRQSVSLPARPEGVAAGGDGRVLITTIGTGPGNAANTLLLYDPRAVDTRAVANIVIAPPPPTPPQLPPPSGRPFLAYRSQLIATRQGDRIIGLNANGNNRIVFVYEVASGTVLKSRIVGGLSTVLAVSADGSTFMAGLSLFDTGTLDVLAQQNAANAPFTFPSTSAANFNTQTNQGGSVFAPDGSVLYTGFDIAPDQNPPARPNVSRLLLNDPDNLLIKLGLQLPENLAGKMIIASDGGTIYALSESGFMVLPVSTMSKSPIAIPETQVVLLANDQCGVTAANRTATVAVRNDGSGPMTVTASLLQMPQTGPQGLGQIGAGGGAAGGGIVIVLPPTSGSGGISVSVPGRAGATTPNAPQQQAAVTQTAPQVKTIRDPNGTSFQFSFNPMAGRALGTLTPPHSFLIQSDQAINIPPTVRVYQNNRDAEARSEVIPVPQSTAILEGLVDMVTDPVRNRLYIANSGLNRVEVYDIRNRQFADPIKVGQLPRSLAMSPDGNTLYAADTGGESISVVDLKTGVKTGRIKFPPIPFNGSVGIVTPAVIAAGLSGLQIVMSNGTLWQVIGDQAVPRPVSNAVGRSTIPAPRTMAATPNGENILLLAGDGYTYLYDAMVDEYVAGKQLFNRPIQGLYGPIAAGPRGQYYLVNGQVFNSSLTPITAPSTGIGQTSRPVAAVAVAGTTTFVRLSQPALANNNALAAQAPLVEVVDVSSGATLRSVSAVEGPLANAVGANPQFQGINGRTMAVDPAGTTAYVLTASGLSVVPLDAPARAELPAVNQNGVVNMASYLPSMASGGLVSVFGRNLAAEEVAGAAPLPTILGGACLTLAPVTTGSGTQSGSSQSLSGVAMPLIMTSGGQINAQIPPELPAGRYQMLVRSLSLKAASNPYNLTVAKIAPAVFVDPPSGLAAIVHEDGTLVSKDHPARRDEKLIIYATGLGPTKGGKVVAGAPAPSKPLAEVDDVKVFFGNPDWKQAEMIVDWCGLAPGYVGLYQINVRVPGEHMNGDKLPVTIRVGSVSSPSKGPVVATVAVD